MSELSFIERVAVIQSDLNAPKGQYNSFGKYHYRSAEDILTGVKPLLKGLLLRINDEIVQVGDRYYVKATAKITDGRESVEASAFAREPLQKKGMDESQITGATSSYARKYALNGLLGIDDVKDADTQAPADNKSPAKTANNKGSGKTYVIPVGKNKGKDPLTLSNDELLSDLEYWEGVNSKTKLTGPAGEYLAKLRYRLNK